MKKDVIARIAEIAIRLNPVELVTPTNEKALAKAYKQAYLSGATVSNPKFEFDTVKLKAAANWLEELEELQNKFSKVLDDFPVIEDGDHWQNLAVEGIMCRRINDAVLTAKMAKAMLDGDMMEVRRCVFMKYGKPTATSICLAHDVRSRGYSAKNLVSGIDFSKVKFTHEEYDAEQIRDAFLKAIEIYGIQGWQVVIDPHTLAIDVRDKTASGESVIVIPSDRKMSGPKLCEIIGHEIECHLRDSENSRAFWESVLTPEYKPLIPILAKSDDEFFYEGHAKVNDVKVLGEEALPLPDYIITIEMAMKGFSFNRMIYEFTQFGMGNGKSDSEALNRAWINCKRMFRGCLDTENPLGYALTKDRAYFEGYHVVKNFSSTEFATMTLQDTYDLREAGFCMIPKYYDLELCLQPEKLGLV